MRRRRSLERQTVRSVPIGRPCDERSLASCVQTVAWRSRISQRGRRKHPSQIALGAHRATFGHWLNLFHGGSRDHRSARCYRQSKCTSLRQPCAPTAIGEGGFCSGLFITHLLLLSNQNVPFHHRSSTWCTVVSPLTEISRISRARVELKMNSTPVFRSAASGTKGPRAVHTTRVQEAIAYTRRRVLQNPHSQTRLQVHSIAHCQTVLKITAQSCFSSELPLRPDNPNNTFRFCNIALPRASQTI